jgi:hypothetical protein
MSNKRASRTSVHGFVQRLFVSLVFWIVFIPALAMCLIGHAGFWIADFIVGWELENRKDKELEHCIAKAKEWSIETQNDRTKWMDDYEHR